MLSFVLIGYNLLLCVMIPRHWRNRHAENWVRIVFLHLVFPPVAWFSLTRICFLAASAVFSFAMSSIIVLVVLSLFSGLMGSLVSSGRLAFYQLPVLWLAVPIVELLWLLKRSLGRR